MKKQALLIVAAGMLLASCGVKPDSSESVAPVESESVSVESKPESASEGTKPVESEEESSESIPEESSESTSESEPEPSSEPSSEPSEADPYEVLEAFFANLEEEKNFTMHDREWRMVYGYGEDAVYMDYSESEMDEYTSGLVSHPTEGILEFQFDEEGKVAPYNVVDAEFSYGESVYMYIYSPIDLAADGIDYWDAQGDGVFTSEETDIYGLAAALADYGFTAAKYVESVELTVADDATSASLVVDFGEDGITYLDITVGDAESEAIDEWRENPVGMPEYEDDGRLEVFLTNLEAKNFVMTDPGYRTVYGYGEDAYYNEYADGDGSWGLVAHPTEGVLEFEFDEEGKVKPTDVVSPTGTNVYEYVYSVVDFLDYAAEDYTMTAANTYSISDSYSKTLGAALAGYNSSLASYVTAINLEINEDGTAAKIVVDETYFGDGFELGLTLGNAQSDAIDEWRENPVGMPELDADSPIVKFYENLSTIRNFTMVDEDYLTISGYSDSAVLYEYASGNTYGFLVNPGTTDVYKYTFGEEGEVVLDETPAGTSESVYSVLNTPMRVIEYSTASTWTEDSEGVYTTTNGTLAQIFTMCASWPKDYYTYMKNMTLTVDADGMHAVFTAALGSNAVNLDITIGNASNAAVDAFLGAE